MEGIPGFAAKSKHLTLHEDPSRSSPIVATVPVKKGEEIVYSATRFRTVRPGIVTGTEPKTLSGRSFGPIGHLSVDRYYASEMRWKEISFKAGDSFEYLQDRAEGICLIRHENAVLEIEDCSWSGSTRAGGFKLVEEPETEWWIQVTGRDKPPLGWLLVDST